MFRRILQHRTNVTCSKLSAYSNAVTLITEHDIQHMGLLQRYLQLVVQHVAVCYVALCYALKGSHNKQLHIVPTTVNNAVTPTYAIYHAL